MLQKPNAALAFAAALSMQSYHGSASTSHAGHRRRPAAIGAGARRRPEGPVPIAGRTDQLIQLLLRGGRRAEADGPLEKVVRLIEEDMPRGGSDPGRPAFGWNWQNRIHAEAVRREAEGVVKGG